MCQIKNPHRPNAPKAARLPTHGTGDREAITNTSALDFLAAGAKQNHVGLARDVRNLTIRKPSRAGGIMISIMMIWHRGRYVFYSCLRSLSGRLRQFGPDLLPVVGEKVFARDLLVRSRLDCDSKFDGDRAGPAHPLIHRTRRNAKLFCAINLVMRLEVGFKVHANTLALLTVFSKPC